jgi:hypothetical protein
MTGLLHKARRYLFGYDAVESKNRRQAPTGRLRSEDKELLPHQRRKLTSASRDIHRNFTIAAWAIRTAAQRGGRACSETGRVKLERPRALSARSAAQSQQLARADTPGTTPIRFQGRLAFSGDWRT